MLLNVNAISFTSWVMENSGRYENNGEDLMSFTDRHGRDYLLGPTHEEAFYWP